MGPARASKVVWLEQVHVLRKIPRERTPNVLHQKERLYDYVATRKYSIVSSRLIVEIIRALHFEVETEKDEKAQHTTLGICYSTAPWLANCPSVNIDRLLINAVGLFLNQIQNLLHPKVRWNSVSEAC